MEEVIKKEENEYYFQGVRFVPGYNDFDFDDIVIVAETVEEAWKLLDVRTNIRTWKNVGLIEINNARYYEGV